VRRIVCRSEDLRPGEMREVAVEGRSVVVLRTAAGAVCALRGVCPHQGAPLVRGTLTGTTVPSSPFQYRYGRRGEILRCPWHHYEFDVLTGRSLVDPERCRVDTYRVEEEGGDVALAE
jgi:nitrite reductase (NADH) small subunit